MIDPRDERLWAKFFNSYLQARLDPSLARAKADEALKEYKERWPQEQSASAPVGGLDSAMILRAVSQLEAERRIDAALIVKSLYEALRTAQSKGERLLMWELPARDGQVLPPKGS